MHLSADDTRRLAEVALGDRQADLVITGGSLLNVYTGELLPEWQVAVHGERIAYVGPDASHTVGPHTQVVDIGDQVLVPGFIEGHTHIAYRYAMHHYLEYAARGGLTTIISETSETAFVWGGERAVEVFLDSARDQPIKVFATLPPMLSASPTPNRGMLTAEQFDRLLADDRVVGLGETYWPNALRGQDRSRENMAATWSRGKTVEGHSAGARGRKLAAYAALGVTSCHEPIRPDEVLERLRLGMHTMLREGDIRHDLEALSAVHHEEIDFRRLCLVTDTLGPSDLLRGGELEQVVQKAIDLGFPPVAAIQMATLNVAEHFRLDWAIGGIAPGRYADLVVLPDLQTVQAQLVVSNGRTIARGGRLEVPPRRHEYPEWLRACVQLPRPVTVADLAVAAPPGAGDTIRVRVIDLVSTVVTHEAILDLPVRDGEVCMDPARDVVKIVAVDRANRPGTTFAAFARGSGLHTGALASTWSWDSPCMVAYGASDRDIAAALNRLREIGGGLVAIENAEVAAEVPSPIGSFISDVPIPEMAASHEALEQQAARQGARWPNPFLTLEVMTGAAIPHLRISEVGLINVREGRPVSLLIDA